MADRRRDILTQSQPRSAASRNTGPLTASTQIMAMASEYNAPPIQYESWQEEAWTFYETLGEFNRGVEWFGDALSRVRLNVAKITPGGDEPEPLDSGPATELIESLMGGIGGQSQMMKSFATQISVPGEGYLVGREVRPEDRFTGVLLDAEPDENNQVWTVQPVNTVKRSQRTIKNAFGLKSRAWELQVDEGRWVSLPDESMICRVWDRNEHFPWRATSPAKAALPIMREIDMYNRYIIATLMSRVALNGMLLIPDEVTLPVNPNYENAADPFMAELIDIMRSAIKNPGSPVSAAPVPLRVPAQYIEQFKHFTFATPFDDKIFQARTDAVRRLATTLNLPTEVLTGMGDVNHWTAWQLTEDAIKTHISPKVEIITRGLTLGYLYPRLKADGQKLTDKDGNRLIVWYDTSELTQRPDRSESAMRLREMFVINDVATRRETGFDEADAPTDDELEKMVLQVLAVNPQTAAPALKELTGLELEMPQPAPVAGDPSQPSGPAGDTGAATSSESSTPQAPATGRPPTRDTTPPSPDEGMTASLISDVQSLSPSGAVDLLMHRVHSGSQSAERPLTSATANGHPTFGD